MPHVVARPHNRNVNSTQFAVTIDLLPTFPVCHPRFSENSKDCAGPPTLPSSLPPFVAARPSTVTEGTFGALRLNHKPRLLQHLPPTQCRAKAQTLASLTVAAVAVVVRRQRRVVRSQGDGRRAEQKNVELS